MASAVGSTTPQAQLAVEKAFVAKKFNFQDASLLTRALALVQQLHITPEGLANQYETFALVNDWSSDVTAQRLKMLTDYLETEQRKENAKPKAGASAAVGGTTGLKGLPQSMRPTWDDLPEKLDFPTPSAKRQALDTGGTIPTPSHTSLGAGAQAKGPLAGSAAVAGGASAATPSQRAQLGSKTPLFAASGGTPSSAPPSAFAMRTNRGQIVATLHDHLPTVTASGRTSGVALQTLGQPQLMASDHRFMMEPLDTKIHALDDRIVDFAEALARAASGAPTDAADAAPGDADMAGGALQHRVSDIQPEPVWVSGRIVGEVDGAPLNASSLLIEGSRDASGGARVRLDVSSLPVYRLFPGQSVCAWGLNPTGMAFMAHRLVTHLPAPPASSAISEAARREGLSMVVAAGPFTLSDDLSFVPLTELLAHCSAHPPDVLLLLGPFVDCEHPLVAKGLLDRPLEAVWREEVVARVAGWRAKQPGCSVALMPSTRDANALPVFPQPALQINAANKVQSLQNPSTCACGPLVLGASTSDVLKALSSSELAAAAPGQERLPALASHIIGQRNFFPVYPPPVGSCLDTCHDSQLQLPVTPDLLLLPSDLAPFAKLLQPAQSAHASIRQAAAGASAFGGAVVALNPGRLARGTGAGTFAHVSVVPGPAPLVERLKVEIKRL